MSELSPTPPARLRRTPLMRMVGGPLLQPVWLVQIVAGVALAVPAPPEARWYILYWTVAAAVPWLVGATAWIAIDDDGLHRRCFVRRDYRWDEITGVRTALFWQESPRRYHLLVEVDGSWHSTAPAYGSSRAHRQFAQRVGRAAQARGIPADVPDQF